MANIKIPKSEYPVIARMRQAKFKWSDIAAIYGCTAGHLMDMKSEIMATITEGAPSRKSDLVAAKAMHILLTDDDADKALRAGKTLLEVSPDNTDTATGSVSSDEKLIVEIKRELSSS